MGFLDFLSYGVKAVGRALGSAIESAGKYFGNNMISNFGKSVKDACSNVARETRKVASTTNHKAESAVRVNNINNVFVGFYNEIKEKAEDIENACIGYAEEYFDSMLDVLSNQDSEIRKSLNKKLRRSRDKVNNAIRGFIIKDVSRKVSLDNSRCMNIMKIEDDSKRGEAMSRYCGEVVAVAVKKLDKRVQNILNTQNESIEEFLLDYEDKKSYALENMKSQLEEMEKEEISTAKENEERKDLKQLRVIMYMDAILSEMD